MKKNSFLIIIFLSFSILSGCSQNNSLEEMGLEKYVDKDMVIALDCTVKEYDTFLSVNYKQFPKEEQSKKFLNDFYNSSISDDPKKFEHYISLFNHFKKDMDSLKINGFFDLLQKDNKPNESIKEALVWKNSLQLFSQNQKTKDSLEDENSKNRWVGSIRLEYYYGIYNLAKKQKDTLTINWIEAKINTQTSFPAIAYIRTLPNEYLNSTLCKTMIFTEFILPFYDFKHQVFKTN